MKSKKNVFSTILIIIILSFGAKLLGFLRDSIVAKDFMSIDTDAYYSAINATAIFFTSIGTGIGAALIPIIVSLRNLSNKEKNSKLNNIFNVLILISIVITIIGLILSPQIARWVTSDFQENQYAVTVSMIRIIFPSLCFILLAYAFVAYLQAHENYLITAFMSLPYNLITIFYLLMLANHYKIIGLAVFTLIGWVLQLLIQMPSAYKSGYRYSFNIDFKDKDLQRFFALALPIIIVAAVQQVNVLLDTSFSTGFGVGRASAIYYSNILYIAIASVTVNGITSVMFPKFSITIADGDNTEFNNTVSEVIANIIIILAAMGAGLSALARPIVSLIWERGKFGELEVSQTAMVLSIYSIAMLSFAVNEILNKAFYSKKKTKVPVICGTLTILINLILNIILGNLFGAIGIPIATTIAVITSSILLVIIFNNGNNGLIKRIWATLLKSVVSASLMWLAVYKVATYGQTNILIESNFLKQLIILVVATSIGVIVYFVLIILLKEKTVLNHIKQFKVDRKRR